MEITVDEAVEFCLPLLSTATRWRTAVDTAAPPSDDLPDPGSGSVLEDSSRSQVRNWAMIVLVAQAP